jgi:FKBP-type peptidyl-prolyl cis-trans isomerase SlyD
VIKDGSKVQFHYSLKVDDEQVESSEGREPLSYTHGEGEIIPGLESELEGLEVGAKKSVTIPPAEGYGERNDSAVQEVPKEAFQNADELNQGDMVNGQIAGQPFRATVAEVGDETVTLDLNHPLAGKTLNFEVEVVAVD